jgi:hypothetical protein
MDHQTASPARGLRRGLTIGAAALALALAAPLGAQTVHVPGIDSLHVRSNIQGQFNSTSVDDEPDTAWLVRRARIMIRMFAAGWIRAEVEGDFGRGGARLTDGFVRLDFDPRFRIRAGQYKKPFDAQELVSSRELLVIERDGLPRGASLPTPNDLVKGLGYSDRDIGAEWNGRFGPATLIAGFWNGAGANTAENDDGKQVAARLEFQGPADWTLAGALTGIDRDVPLVDEEGEEIDREESESEWRKAFELAAAHGEYGEPGLKILAQFMAGDGTRFDEVGPETLVTEVDQDFAVLHAILAYHIGLFDTPHLIGIEPLARAGWADPDTDGDNDEATLWTAGVNLYHHEHVKTQFQVDHVSPSEGDGETAFRVQLGLGF